MTVIGSRKPARQDSGHQEAKPSQAKPSQAKPSQAKPSQAKPSQAKPGQAKPGQAGPGSVSPGALFSDFPGPVIFFDSAGEVDFANRAASRLAQLWSAGTSVELKDAIASGQDGHVAQVAPLILGSGLGEGEPEQVFDLIVLPWEQGGVALFGREISLERSLRSALIDSRQRYKDLVEASSDFAWETDIEGGFTFITPHGALGYSAGELVGHPSHSLLMHVENSGQSPFVAKVAIGEVEVWVRNLEGEAVCLAASALPLFGAEGEWSGARGTCRDITAERLRQAEQARAAHRQGLLAYLLRMTREQAEPARMLEAVARSLLPALSIAGAEIFCRTEAGDLLSIAQAGDPPPGDGFGPLMQGLEDGQSQVQGEEADDRFLVHPTAYQGRGNGALCLWWQADALEWGREGQVLLEEVVAQVGAANRQVQREDRLEKLSTTDPLTGLENRRGFIARVGRLLEQREGEAPVSALFYIDLDNFKQVNDSLGHQAGDRALQGVAEVLRRQVRAGDLAARLGGDEFALFFPAMSEDAARRRGEALLGAVDGLKEFSAHKKSPLGFSVGIAVTLAAVPESAESLVARADVAMYEVKNGAKAGLAVAGPPEAASPS